MTELELAEATQPAVPRPEELREQMVAQLIQEGALDDPAIEAAFRAVPREVFAPAGTPVEQVYAIHDVVRTRFAETGECLSSLSAPFMQHGNLRQSQVESGMRVLEIGSAGPLASMLAQIVGPEGQVVTVDIDEGVTARTRAGLAQTGLSDRIEVITADAGRHLNRGVFDRIIVTVAAWTIPPVWLDQLAPDGLLVVPLRIAPGAQRILTFRRTTGVERGRLVAEETVLGGFVPMQGDHVHHHPVQALTGPSGGTVTFRFAEHVPEDFAVTDEVLGSDPVLAWSGVTYSNGEVWVDMLLWLLLAGPGACEIKADEATDVGHDRPFLVGLVQGDSFAMLTRRVLGDGAVEIGAVGKGSDAAKLTQTMTRAMREYDTQHRGGPVGFDWWPGLQPAVVSPSLGTAASTTVLPRPHGTLTVNWPGAGSR